MNFSFEKKQNFFSGKINFSILVLLSVIIFILNLVQGEKFIKINFLLKKTISYPSLSAENLFSSAKKLKLNIKIFFNNASISGELFEQNLNLINQINFLKNENEKILSLVKQKEKIEKTNQNLDKFDFLPGKIVSNSKDEILILTNALDLKDPKSLENNIIYNKGGLIGRIKKIYRLENNFILFGQKINHESFKIPVVTKKGHIGVLNGKTKKIENLNFITDFFEGDEVFLMNQEGKIPENLKIGEIKKIHGDSSIEIEISSQKEDLLGQNVFIIYEK